MLALVGTHDRVDNELRAIVADSLNDLLYDVIAILIFHAAQHLAAEFVDDLSL
jgi:hypothetical protein